MTTKLEHEFAKKAKLMLSHAYERRNESGLAIQLTDETSHKLHNFVAEVRSATLCKHLEGHAETESFRLDEFKSEDVEKLVKFAYTGEANYHDKDYAILVKLATKMDFPAFKQACTGRAMGIPRFAKAFFTSAAALVAGTAVEAEVNRAISDATEQTLADRDYARHAKLMLAKAYEKRADSRFSITLEDGSKHPLHNFVAESYSRLLQRHLQSQAPDAPFVLQSCASAQLEQLIKCLYTGQMDWSEDDYPAMMKLCNILQISFLSSLMLERLDTATMDEAKFLLIMNLVATMDEPQTFQLLIDTKADLFASFMRNTAAIASIDAPVMEAILRANLSQTEDEVAKALSTWLANDASNGASQVETKKALCDLLQLHLMSKQGLAELLEQEFIKSEIPQLHERMKLALRAAGAEAKCRKRPLAMWVITRSGQFKSFSVDREAWLDSPMQWIKFAVGTSVVQVHHKVYLIGGLLPGNKKSDAVNIFDLETSTWSPGPPLQRPRSHIQTVLFNDDIYLLGGQADYEDYSVFVEKRSAYAEEESGWQTLKDKPFSTDRFTSFAVVLTDGCRKSIYMASIGSPNMHRYDGQETWEEMASLPFHYGPRALHGTVEQRWLYLFTCERSKAGFYDAKTNHWTEIDSKPDFHAPHGAVNLLTFGGNCFYACQRDCSDYLVTKYDLSRNEWTQVPDSMNKFAGTTYSDIMYPVTL